jgi:tape measure domain-containing protein
MSSVDDRIVNMQFNNKQFTQGVNQSQRDLTGLDKTLANAGKNSGLDKMGSAAQQVSTKFSAMQVAGVTAIATIANQATLAAGRLLKKLTIQPILDGFREYTTNLESIQTIMANTGKSVDVVNKYLGELNDYSDQTIYNFSQMAKNIGTFTAAGVELDTATSAIKGISNLAALSGSNSQQASTAMYQLSQAIAAGKVGLMDWNSVVNAGMGGKVFKNALAQTAVAMGGLSADAVKVGTDVEIMGQSFRNSISAAAGQESWLSSKVLVSTLSQLDGRFSKTALAADGYKTKQQQLAQIEKERIALAKEGIEYSDKEFDAMVKKADAAYAAATQIKTATQLFQVVQESIGSMWAQAFQIVLGDFEQSKKLWGNVGDVVMGIIDDISGNFLGALRIWEDRGGRMKVIEGLSNVFGGLVDIMRAVAKGFDRAFPDTKVSLLNRISKAFFAFSEALVPSKDTLKDIATIAEGVFSVLHFGFTLVKGVAKGLAAFFGALFGATDGARGGILDIAASIAEVVIAFEGWLTSGSKITRFLRGIGEVAGGALAPIVSIIGSIISAIGAIATGNTGKLIGIVHDIRNTFLGMIESVLNGLASITAPIGAVSDFFSNLADSVGGAKTTLSDLYRDINSQSGVATPLVTALQSIQGAISAIGDAVQGGFGDIADLFERAGDGASKMASAVGGGATKGFGKAAEEAQGFYDAVTGPSAAAAAASTGAVAAGGEKVGSVFESIGDTLKTVGTGIADAFGWMVDAISNIPFPDDALEWATVLNALISGALIKRLFFSQGILGQLKDSIKQIGKAATDSFDQLTNTLKTMQGAIKSEMIKNIAIAVALLVASLVVLSFIPTEKLAAGLGALSATMLMAGAMMQVMMAGLKRIPVKDLVKYGVGFTLVGVGMIAMATSVLILTAAVAALAFIPFDKLKQGLGAVAILMGIMTASLLLLSGQGAKVAAVGAAMALMAVAIDAMVIAVMALGLLPLDKVEQGLTAVAIGIGIMTASLLLLSGSSAKVLAAGGAMVLMATALNILIPLIVTMGLLPWSVVEQGLKAVAIGLGIMTLALLVLSGGGPAIMAAGAAMVMIAGALNILIPLIVTLGALPWEVVSRGLAAMAIALTILVAAGALAMFVIPGMQALAVVILAIGAAMLMAGTGMALFSAGLAVLVAVGVAAIGIIVLAIHAFIALLPSIAIQMAAAFVTFLQAIALASPKIRKAMGEIFKNMLGVIDDNAPRIANTLEKLVKLGLDTIVKMQGHFVEAGYTLIMGFLDGIENKFPNIVTKATDAAIAFINALGDNAVKFANAGADALIKVLNGFEDAVRTKGPQIRSAVKGLADALKDEFIALTRDIFTSIPMPSLPDWIKNPSSILPGMRTKAGNKLELDYTLTLREGKESLAEKLAKSLQAAGESVATAIEGAVRLLTGGDGTSASATFARQADAAETEAVKQSTKAGLLDKSATAAEEKVQRQRDKASKIKDKKKREAEMARIRKNAAAEAKQLRKNADKAARIAEKQQEKAEEAATRAQQEMSFEAATKIGDFRGAGDIRSQQGQDIADKAQALLAESQAKAERADKLAKGNKKDREEAKKLRKEARAAADEANKLALDAIQFQRDAAALYESARAAAQQAVVDRMKSIREDLAEQDAARAWQDQFDALEGNDEAQAAMLNARAADAEAKEAAARAEMDRQLALAESLAATDAEAAMAALDEAERQAQLASQYADAADRDRDQAADMLKQVTTATNSGTTTSGAQITPSRTALEDAASAVDRYTTSLQQAEELAGAGTSSVTFNQNNYSPEALPASTLYRHGKNLVAAAELKMAGH